MVRPSKFKIKADTDASDVAWFNIKSIPLLAFDHNKIIDVALHRLKAKIVYEPIGFELLDKRFPFSELERLYSTVIGKPIDRRNFKKKIMRYGFLKETTERQQLKGAGRPGFLFQFDEKKYFRLKKKGINIEL